VIVFEIVIEGAGQPEFRNTPVIASGAKQSLLLETLAQGEIAASLRSSQ